MRSSLTIIVGLLIGAPSFLFSSLMDENKSDSFLFCIRKENPQLEVSRDTNGRLLSIENDIDIHSFISENGIIEIERWLPNASEHDRDGDVALNRIYRLYLEPSRIDELPELIQNLQMVESVLYAEPENIHKLLYAPNDTNLDEQCSLPSMKVYDAWDFWDINNGDIPGVDNSNYQVVLASVDTGVDYTHPDLENNAWINQGEIPPWTFEAGIDANNDGFIEAAEIIDFVESQGMDFNNDGESNLRDILYQSDIVSSPFLDGIDSDGNGYTDDILGWDCSGLYGSATWADADPYPKEGVPNSSTWAHGTEVAGILAATTDNGLGMASATYNAKFMSVKASKDNQSDDEPGINNGYDGILYAAKAGHQDYNNNNSWDPGEPFTIINNSWGGGVFSNSENSTINVAHNTYGAVVVAAAGNGDDEGGDEYADHYPSSYENCISVSAIKCSGSWGGWATYHPTIDIGAPGDNIFAPIIGTGYDTVSGSSFASPNAASVIGLLSYYYPEFNNQALRNRIEATADQIIYDLNPEFIDCDGSSGEYCLGSGMIDAYKAIGVSFSPSISFSSYQLSFDTGNGDDVLNPGESVQLFITLENEQDWMNAEDLTATLSVTNSHVEILNNYSEYGLINSGDSAVNSSSFSFSVNNEIALGDLNFKLSISANGVDYIYNKDILFKVPVTMDQSGFPFNTNFSVKSSPLVVDFDNDGSLEMIFGDKNGLVHVVSSDGVEWDNNIFPFDVGDEIWGSIAYADIDLDGLNEIVVGSKSKHLYALDMNGVDFDFDSGQFLIATPAIGNIDEDEYLEVVISGFTSSGDIFIVNHNGVADIVEINEKVSSGVALADFDDDGKDEIIVTTENYDMICMIDDLFQIDTLFIAGNKFKTSPSILDLNGEKIIMAGSDDDTFYAIDSHGELLFSIEAEDDIVSSPSFFADSSGVAIFFGSDDGYLHAIDQNGNALDGWPILFNDAPGDASFSDLDGDGIVEIVFGVGNQIHAIKFDGTSFNPNHFPIYTEFPIESAATIVDFDNDSDLEIIMGSSVNVEAIDILDQNGIIQGFWSMHRANNARTGLFEAVVNTPNVQLGDVNFDNTIDVFDIIIVVNIVIGEMTPSTEQFLAADVNQDSAIDVFDIISLINIILG